MEDVTGIVVPLERHDREVEVTITPTSLSVEGFTYHFDDAMVMVSDLDTEDVQVSKHSFMVFGTDDDEHYYVTMTDRTVTVEYRKGAVTISRVYSY